MSMSSLKELPGIPQELKHPQPITVTPSSIEGSTLPYHDLGGRGLERLCYLLLVEEGQSPRFFAENGQADFGVDILVHDNENFKVYQCKNLKKKPSPADLRGYIEKFRKEWISTAQLPSPTHFILCCPQPFEDLNLNQEWPRLCKEAEESTGVNFSTIWDRNILDAKLKKKPDLVALIFSDRYSQAFCPLIEWQTNLFQPLTEEVPSRKIRRYLELKKSNQIYLDPQYLEKFEESFGEYPVILGRGLPGTGKTMATLAFADHYRKEGHPVYYVDLQDSEFTRETLLSGIKARCSRHSLFIIDDCHLALSELDWMIRSLAGKLRENRMTLICLMRYTPADHEDRGDYSEWVEELDAQGATIDFNNNDALIERFILKVKPQFAGISPLRLKRIIELCGHDLFILADLLTNLEKPSDLDDFDTKKLYRNVRKKYFGTSSSHLPTVKKLSALAQFELEPLVEVFQNHWEKGEEDQIKNFLVKIGHPPRYHFLHSSGAELIFLSLVSPDMIHSKMSLVDEIYEYLKEYFQIQQTLPGWKISPERLTGDLLKVFTNQRKLTPRDFENELREKLLSDHQIYDLIKSFSEQTSNLSLPLVCIQRLHQSSSPLLSKYVSIVVSQLIFLLSDPVRTDETEQFHQILAARRFLEKNIPEILKKLEDQLHPDYLLNLILANGTILKLLKVIQSLSQSVAYKLIEGLNQENVDELISKTIAQECSIGTLHLPLWELRKNNPKLLEKLEKRLGAQSLLKLIRANGTISELFRLIQYSSPTVAISLVEGLDQESVDELISKTITQERSIGTLDLTLRELRKKNPKLLEKLEKRLGAQSLLKLIRANGTIFELFRLIQHSSPTVATGLIEGLNQESVDELINKTIAQERSIGTLDLTLWELRKNNPKLLEKLEKRLGAQSLLKLIRANGTIFELFKMIEHSSPAMATSLIEGLDQESVDELISKTIAQERSIGTLNLTFRELKQKQAILLRVFEEKLGSSAIWKLVSGCGTFKELSFFLDDMSLDFAQMMVIEAEEYPQSFWEQLVLQGSYWDFVYFLEHALSYFVNSPVKNCLFLAMELTLPQVLLKSSWYEINSGTKKLCNLELTDFKELAFQNQKNFLDQIDVSELKFESFNEAMNALQCLFRERKELRNRIFSQLWKILPNCQVWGQEKHYWSNIRMLISLHRETELNLESIQPLLEKLKPNLDLKKADPIQASLVLWELYAMQQEWQISDFSPILNYLKELTEQAIRLFKTKNAQKMGQQELLKLLSLFGILMLWGQPVEKITTKTFREQVSIGNKKMKYQLLNYSSFLPAYFGLHGLQMLLPQRHIFTPLASKDLAALLYPEIDPVFQSLLEPPCIQAGRRLLELNINMIEDLKPGMKLWGQVTGTQVYGIFIDLGVNKNGLLHKSQITHYNLTHLETTFPLGSWVEVEILKVDLKKEHIELRLTTTN